MLEAEGWATRRPLSTCVFENTWPDVPQESDTELAAQTPSKAL
jgi:hypothetical protein